LVEFRKTVLCVFFKLQSVIWFVYTVYNALAVLKDERLFILYLF